MEQLSSFFDFPSRIHRGWRWLPWVLLLAITAALYGETLYFRFVWDDYDYIRDNPLATEWSLEGLKRIWTNTHLGHYAPVTITVFAWLRDLAGFSPFGFHAAQLAIHGLCVVLVFLLLRKLESGGVAFLGALLFAVHPANIETVAWISELKSTLAFLFFLLSFWFFIRFREEGRALAAILAGVLLIASLLAKINTVVAPAIFLLYDYRQGATLKTLRWKSLTAYLLICVAMAVIHLRAFHGSSDALRADYYHNLGVHIFGIPSILAFYFQMIVFPYPLSAWQMFPAPDENLWVNVLGWFGLLAMAGLLYRASRNTQFWALWILVFLAPVLQFVPFGIWVADRYLYIPAIGGFVLIAYGFSWLLQRTTQLAWRAAIQVALIAGVCTLAWQTRDHLPVWRNNVTLWADTLPHCMRSAYCHSAYGLALQEAGFMQEGGEELVRAVQMAPDSEVFLVYLADSLTMIARNYPMAIQAYQQAITITLDEEARGKRGRFTLSAMYWRLARAHIYAGQYEDARQTILKGMQNNPADPAHWAMETLLQWKLGDMDGARKAIESLRAVTGDQQSPVQALMGRFWGDKAQIIGFLKVFEA